MTYYLYSRTTAWIADAPESVKLIATFTDLHTACRERDRLAHAHAHPIYWLEARTHAA